MSALVDFYARSEQRRKEQAIRREPISQEIHKNPIILSMTLVLHLLFDGTNSAYGWERKSD
jgi:hypothetical protein